MDSIVPMDNISRLVDSDNINKKEINSHHEYSLKSTACQTSSDHIAHEPSYRDFSVNCPTESDLENRSPKSPEELTLSESTLSENQCMNDSLINDKSESSPTSQCNLNNSDSENLSPTSCDFQCASSYYDNNGVYKLTYEQLLKDYKSRKVCSICGEILKYTRTKVCNQCTHCGKFYLCDDCFIDGKYKDSHDYDFVCTDP